MYKKLLATSCLSVIPLFAQAKSVEAYDWAGALTLEGFSNLDGGIKRGTRSLINLDATLTIDTQAAGWWDGGTWFGYVLGNYGKPPTALSGDLQTLSNIEADNNLKVYEFWYQHSFAQGAFKFLIGLHDYNSTFDVLDSAGLFALSSFGINPEISQVSPSIFPTTAPAVHLTFAHGDQYLLLAVYDGVAGDPKHTKGTHIVFGKDDGLFKAIEWGIARSESYKIALGAWQHTALVENPVDGSMSNRNSGFYLIGEKKFSEKFSAFFQYGHADAKKNQLENYAGAGVIWSNCLSDGDAFGVGYASAHNGSPYLKMNADLLSAENIVNITYQRPLAETLSIQPSLYYVEHPSMSPSVDNALAASLRLYIDF